MVDTCFVVNAEDDFDQTAALFSVDAGDGVTLLLDREIDYQDTFTVRDKKKTRLSLINSFPGAQVWCM